jgi:hypothetical protein
MENLDLIIKAYLMYLAEADLFEQEYGTQPDKSAIPEIVSTAIYKSIMDKGINISKARDVYYQNKYNLPEDWPYNCR